MIACFFITLVNYAVVVKSSDVLELAKDYTALLVIANFDNLFAAAYIETDLIRKILDSE